MSKQYGLIVPNKSKPLHPIGPVRPSIFGDDSDSDSGPAKPTGLKTALKRQDRLLQERAVEEDPTVFQYDELYDDMDAKRKESKLARKDLDRKPKYISKLMASAERRKRENERRIERQVQKEREAEGEEFKDKESFVTSAYRAKLEELKKMDEEERREEYLEAIGDVKKQGNLDGFYRHLYDQKVLYEDKGEQEKVSKSELKEKLDPKKRKYRKRDENSDSEPEVALNVDTERLQLQHMPSNIDADSDFSIDSSGSDEENEDNKKLDSSEASKMSEIKEKDDDEKTQTNDGDTAEKVVTNEILKDEAPQEKAVAKPKIDIWKKRTVGEAFDEAVKRYFERKALREAGTYVRPVS